MSLTIGPIESPRAMWWQPLRLAALTVATAVFVAYVATSGFFLDDFRNLADARRGGLSWDFLTAPLFEHFAPGHKILDWLVIVPFGPSHVVATLLLTAALLVALWSASELFFRVSRRPVLSAALTALLGTSWPILGTGQWFAGAAHSLPSLAATCVALLFFDRWRYCGSRRDYAVAVAAAAVALLFWIQAILVPVLLALLTLARATEPHVERWPVRRDVVALVPFVILAAAYFLYVQTRDYAPKIDPPAVQAVADLARTAGVRGFLPSLLGAGLPNEQEISWERLMQGLAALLVVVLVGLGAWLHARVVAALSIVAVGGLGVVATIAGGRLTQVGALAAGNEPRYLTLLPLVTCLAVAVGASTVGSRSMPRGTALAAGAAMFALALLCAVNLRGTYERRSFSRDSASAAALISDRVDDSLRIARDSARSATLVNAELAPPVFYETRTDENELQRLRGFWHGDAPVGAGLELLSIDPQGTLREASFRTIGRTSSCRSEPRCSVRWAIRPKSRELVHARVRATPGSDITVRFAGPMLRKDDPERRLVVPSGTSMVVLPVWSLADAELEVEVRANRGRVTGVALGLLQTSG